MKPKEKARELRDKAYLKIPAVYDPKGTPHFPIAKEMALLVVNEILQSVKDNFIYSIKFNEYWQEVRKEIEKL